MKSCAALQRAGRAAADGSSRLRGSSHGAARTTQPGSYNSLRRTLKVVEVDGKKVVTLTDPAPAPRAADESPEPDASSRPEPPAMTRPSLPLSPVTNDEIAKARYKYRHPTPNHAKEDGAFDPLLNLHRLLKRNPYAYALASPVRHCPVTNTTLPVFFHQQFKLVAHTETGEPWWMPSHFNLGRGKQFQPRADPTAAMPGKGAYALARGELLRAMSPQQQGRGGGGAGSRYANGHRRLMRMGRTARDEALAGRAVWRRDMHDVVLRHRRRRAADEILAMAGVKSRTPIDILQRFDGDGEFRGTPARGCVLAMGDEAAAFKPRGGEAAAGAAVDEEGGFEERFGAVFGGGGEQGGATAAAPRPHRFGPFAPIKLGTAKYGSVHPIYDLTRMLGEEEVRRLREEGPEILREGSMYLVHGDKRTAGLQLMLWSLEGYLIESMGSRPEVAKPAAEAAGVVERSAKAEDTGLGTEGEASKGRAAEE